MLQTLKNRDFMNLWLGQLISRLGDGIHEIALAWLVLDLTGSALSMGAILAVSVTPNLLFGLPAGVFVDRFNRKMIMVYSDLARTLIVLVIPLAYTVGVLKMWMIFAGASWRRSVVVCYWQLNTSRCLGHLQIPSDHVSELSFPVILGCPTL